MGRVPLSDEEREPGSVDDGRVVRESGDAWWVNLTWPVVSCVWLNFAFLLWFILRVIINTDNFFDVRLSIITENTWSPF